MAKDRAATLLGWRTMRYAPTELTAIISDLRILLAGDQCANSLELTGPQGPHRSSHAR